MIKQMFLLMDVTKFPIILHIAFLMVFCVITNDYIQRQLKKKPENKSLKVVNVLLTLCMIVLALSALLWLINFILRLFIPRV